MSSKKVIDTYCMARNRWGLYISEMPAGVFTASRIIGERYLTKGGAENAIWRYIDRWDGKMLANERPARKDFKIVKVTVKR